MREITDIREIQKIELEIFDAIHAFCEKRGLRYSLYGGTLIGAIRHKGFIPWDDDIDLAMPRPDYEIFCREFKADGFSVHTHRNDPDYVYPYAKVYHDATLLIEDLFPKVRAAVYVDIFPFDGFPDNGKSLQHAKACRRFYMRLVGYKNTNLCRKKFPWHKKLIIFLSRCILWGIPNRFFLEQFQKEMRKHGFGKMSFVADMTWGYGEKQCVPVEGFSKVVDVDFEGRKVKAMLGWETYLRNVFGNYMQLPPVEKRCSGHEFKAWWK